MEAIQKLLQSTGLSPDELIKQLSEYKANSGPQQIPIIDDGDENINGTLTNGKTNEVSSINLMDDTDVSDISDKIQNRIRTECASVSSESELQKDLFNIISSSVNSDPLMYLCNTSSNSVNSDKSLQSVTISADSSEVADSEFQSCKPQNTNTAKALCNTEVESVIHDQFIKSTDGAELVENSKSDKGTEQFSYVNELAINEFKSSDMELSNSEQLNCAFNSDQESTRSEELVYCNRTEISEELSFNEDLQISEEEMRYDGAYDINREITIEGLSIGEELTRDGYGINPEITVEGLPIVDPLALDEKLISDEGLSTDVNLNCDGGYDINPEITVEGLPIDDPLALDEKLISDEELSTDVNLNCDGSLTSEEFTPGGELLTTEELICDEVPEKLLSDEGLPATEELNCHEELQRNKDGVVSTSKELICDEELTINKDSKSDESKELKSNKRKRKSVFGLKTTIDEKKTTKEGLKSRKLPQGKELTCNEGYPTSKGLKSVPELSNGKELKGYEKLSSSDKLSLVFGLPLGKEVNKEEELSLSDKLRSAWGLPPAKLFKSDKPLPKIKQFQFSWSSATSTDAKCDEGLPTSKNIKSIRSPPSQGLKSNKSKELLNHVWGLSTSEELEGNTGKDLKNSEGKDSKSVCGLSTSDQLKCIERLSSNEKLQTVLEKECSGDVTVFEKSKCEDNLPNRSKIKRGKKCDNKLLRKLISDKDNESAKCNEGEVSEKIIEDSTSKDLKNTEGKDSKSVCGLSTSDQLKSIERLSSNEKLQTVLEKECSGDVTVIEKSKCEDNLPNSNKIKRVKKCDNKLLRKLISGKDNESAKCNEGKVSEKIIEDSTPKDVSFVTEGTKNEKELILIEDSRCDGALGITEELESELLVYSAMPVINEVLIIENSKSNQETEDRNQVLTSDDKLLMDENCQNTEVLPPKDVGILPATVRCDVEEVKAQNNGKCDEVASVIQDVKIDGCARNKKDLPCDEIFDLTMDDDDDDDCLEVTCSEDLDYVEGGYADHLKEEVMDDSDDTIVNDEDVMLYTKECKELNAGNDVAVNESKENSKDSSDGTETSNISRTEEYEISPSRRRPTMGYIRKRHDNSKDQKTTKPSQSEESLNMREQIFSQLQQLRKRKINETPLVDIVNPIPQIYPKRVCKNFDIPETSGSNLGIQIVEVRGGIKEDTIRQGELSPCIKLTKTQDITKIKGWRRKKLLVDKENVKEPLLTVSSNEPNLLINIPVTSQKPDVVDSAASCSYPVDDKSEKSEKAIEDIALNVFASNNLEGFLTQQKNLNISYNVPNLESSNHTIDYLDSTVLMAEPQEEKTHSENKRRYSLADNEDCNTLRQNNKSDTNKPRTLAEKRKLLEQSEILSEDSSMIYSNIYLKAGKLKVPTRYKKAIYIGYSHKSKKQYKYVEIDKKKGRKRKLSILNSQAPVKPEVTYKPGPLCRKQFLQKTGFGEWESVLKKLPKLKVQVLPKIGKPVHPAVVPFVKFETFEISENRVDFALSALLGNSNNKIFTFDVDYKRQQENILMRKKIIKEEVVAGIKDDPLAKVYTEDVDGVVEHMVDDLITCIENSEIENDVIKDDPDFTPYVEDSDTPLKYKETKSKTQVIKGTARRTNLELKRLNVKVIEVNIEDDQKPLDECTKPFCKLGCVCSSLNKTTLPSDHCGNYQCIFKCKCVKKNDTLKFSLPPGTDLLSERTVSRLQDAAKKDLAKVEKEFTQTVIHANNKTIVFSDTIDRKRRSLKFPKRYQDYVETNLLCDDNGYQPLRLVQNIPVPEKKLLPKMKPCTVNLQKLNLEHVIPYCWAHNTYDCDCGCTTLLTKSKPEVFELQVQDPDDISENEKERVKKVKTTPEHCARTKGISTLFYIHRNQMPTFKRKIAKKLILEKSGDNYLLNKWHKMRSFKEQEEPLEWELPSEPISLSSVETKPSRRKQVLITRDELAQRAQETQSQVSSEPVVQQVVHKQRVLDESDNVDVLDDLFQNSIEVYKPSDLVGEKFNQLLGMSNDKESDYRLLQWSTLLKRFEARVWQIWTARTDSKVRFVITNANVKKVNDFINIRSFATILDKESIKTDFIRWILTGSPPGNKEPENTLLILKKTHTLWEVCGMCAKNTTKKSDDDEEQKSNIESVCKNSLFSHKIPFVSSEFIMKELAPPVVTSDLLLDESAKIKAALPNISEHCRWRVLKVHSTFNVLAFTRNRVRTKCSELISLIKLAQRESKTFIINRVSESYKHKLFGIFISYNQPDKIFIGPYYDDEEHDFETLRFLNNKLVSTEEFCKMTGQKIEAPTGTWFKQLASQTQITEVTGSVIDLTENVESSVDGSNSMLAESEDNIEEINITDKEINNLQNESCVANQFTKTSPRSLLKLANSPEPNEVVINEKKQTASIEKIFLMRLRSLMRQKNLPLPPGTYPICFKVNFTNEIILGFKYVAEEMVGISWPGIINPKLFDSPILAAEWLQTRLCNLLVLIPKTFRISVTLVEYSGYMQSMINNKKTLPLSDYYEEVHIVGSFGLLKMTDVVTLMSEYKLKPRKPKDLRNKLSNNSLEYRKMVLKFLRRHDIRDIGFARPLILQMVNQLEVLLKIEQEQIFATENLQKLKSTLEARCKALEEGGNTLNSTPTPSLIPISTATLIPTPTAILNSTPTAEVICLDSDEEESSPLKKSSTILGNLNTTLTLEPETSIQKQEILSTNQPELTIIPLEDADFGNTTNTNVNSSGLVEPVDSGVESSSTSNMSEESIRRFINIASLNENPGLRFSGHGIQLNVNTFKQNFEPKASKKNIVLTLVNGQVLATPVDKLKVQKNLPLTKVLMIPNQSLLKSPEPIERIDLSSFSTRSVSSMLGANLNSKKVTLTKAQLNGLKAISESSKLKRLYLNKIDCDKEASMLEDTLSSP